MSDPAPNPRTLAARLRQRLNELGWSQRRLAEVSGVPQPRLSDILNGQHKPNLATLERIAAAMGCDIELRRRRSG
jgi:transcriptional regulator with XRE-family HTH domain